MLWWFWYRALALELRLFLKYIYTDTHVCACVCERERIYMFMYICMPCVCVCVCVCTHLFTTFQNTDIKRRVCISLCVYASYTYAYTSIHMRIPTWNGYDHFSALLHPLIISNATSKYDTSSSPRWLSALRSSTRRSVVSCVFVSAASASSWCFTRE
jgi:hypothetical protein